MSSALCQSPEFEAKIAKDTLTVVDFTATWCGPCRYMAPTFDELKKSYPEIAFLKIDIDECEDLAIKYDITAVPTFLVFQSGKVVEAYTGASV
jgi:thioredoxin